MKISACIISFNEEKKIEDCLKSIAGVVDEIIVVDSGSTDKTIDIAKKYTDKIYHHDFEGFVKQKNFTLTKASHDWILNLDCDERLSEELKKSILRIKEAPAEYDAYKMPVRTFYIYRWLNHCWYPGYKVRLFNKQKAEWAGLNIHEKVVLSSGKTGILSGDILHYSIESLSDHLKTINIYSELSAKDIILKGKKVTPFKAVSHSVWMMIRLYFLELGLLDGAAGFSVAVLSGFSVFIKYLRVIIYKKTKE